MVYFQGKFLWPGFGENSRVLDWIFRRIDNEDIAERTAIGYVPKQGCLNLDGLSNTVNMTELFSLPKDFWLQEVTALIKHFLMVSNMSPVSSFCTAF
jgi:phosphoenolpyruvate carboxykinase (GTP)